MKVLNPRTVEYTDTEIDVIAYYENLLDEGKGIAVAAFWALRMAHVSGIRLTTEFALHLSEQTLVLNEHGHPVVNRFCPLGVDMVERHLADDPQIAAVTSGRALFAIDLDTEETFDEPELHVGGPIKHTVPSMTPDMLTGNVEPVFGD